MDWKKYEQEICEEFRSLFPDANILQNQHLEGRSGGRRQIDVLIRERVAGRTINIVVDGKYFSRKVDVGIVESFTGLVRDVRADKGILVTNVGYTSGALNRAQSEEDIELDILTPGACGRLQGMGATPYSGSHGVLLPAPFGWVIDGARRPGMVGGMYRRGLSSFEEAQREGELMYFDFGSKRGSVNTLGKLLNKQEKDLRKYPPEVKVEVSYAPVTFPRRDGVSMRLRLARIIRPRPYSTVLEYGGFVDFPDFIFFVILLTREETAMRNLGKLEYVMEKMLPLEVIHGSQHGQKE